jgi:hypothetical protein
MKIKIRKKTDLIPLKNHVGLLMEFTSINKFYFQVNSGLNKATVTVC